MKLTNNIRNLFLALLITGLFFIIKPQNSVSNAQTSLKTSFTQFTFGFVGCSNTQETIVGYHLNSNSAHLFWPFDKINYDIDGRSMKFWKNPNDPLWSKFDNMKLMHNAGQDPPVVWVQICENLDPRDRNFYHGSYIDLQQIIAILKIHVPTSTIYLSPLHTYSPAALCDKMGRDGVAIPELTGWVDQAVSEGLALRGPGNRSDGLYPLGPLTLSLTVSDHCHPNGPPLSIHGQGSQFLGGQLMDFFDILPSPVPSITITS